MKHQLTWHALKCMLLGGLSGALVVCADSPARMFIYPSPFTQEKGQSQATLHNDRYACHVWARDQSGFDPRVGTAAPPPPPPASTPANPHAGACAAGIVAGAVIGGAIGAHHDDSLAAVLIGSTIGAITGGSIETDGRNEARQLPARDRGLSRGTRVHRSLMDSSKVDGSTDALPVCIARHDGACTSE